MPRKLPDVSVNRVLKSPPGKYPSHEKSCGALSKHLQGSLGRHHRLHHLRIKTSHSYEFSPLSALRHTGETSLLVLQVQRMDLRDMGFDPAMMDTLHELLDLSDEADAKSHHAPSRAFLREKRAMAATPADVKEYPNSYVFVLDMPGLKPEQIRVQVEDGNMLVVSGERKREKEKDQKDAPGGGLLRFIKMERRLGKYLKKFVLPENADTEKISASYQEGVLTVTVEKRPPPEPKKPKTVEIQIA